MRTLLCLVLLLGCSDPIPAPTVDIRVITPDSRDPFDEASITRIRLELQQDDADPVVTDEEVDADFDLGLILENLTARARVRVTLFDADGIAFHGAPPPFVPLSSGGLVRILVGPPGRCAVVPRAALPTARARRGHTRADTFAMLLAGLDGETRSTGVTSIDLLRFDTFDDRTTGGLLPALTLASGPARAATFGTSRLLLVTDTTAARYDLAVTESREATVILHPGATTRSAVASIGSAAVVAGGSTAAGTWINAEGRLVPLTLASSRVDGVVAEIGGVALLTGGETPDGAPVAELLRADGSTTPIAGTDGVRRQPVLLRSGDTLLLLGGLDADGAVRTDTLRFDGCPADCRVSAGPEWTNPREGVVAAEDLLVGGAEVERFDGTSLVPFATLQVSRRDPLVSRFESGVLLVAGGESDVPRNEVELCYPEALTPL
ncbi:MAG: hypothetical protein H6721_06205 [Sandaracinus sp.]|nr:hypothetical protein [Sandaracinus sp.]MCB9631718.1 hypothetical protein [Sandaracinus sp.]